MLSILPRFPHAARLLVLCLVTFLAQQASAKDWEGWNKIDLDVDGRAAFLIEPAEPAAGRPWIWRTEFFGHQPQADIALLEHGFHVAYIDVQNLYGGPTAMQAMDALYTSVTTEFKLSPKVVLEGFSRGGLFAINWAARQPDHVACIYNDAPVCDFLSWPKGQGQGKGSPQDWQRLKQVYGFSDEQQAAASSLNPIHQVAVLAKAKIPLLHVCGATDDVVPISENSLIVQQIYEQYAAPMTLISKPHCNHHPHSLQDPTRIVNFVLTHTGMAERLRPATTPYGYDYFSLRGGLPSSHKKFALAQRGRVAFLGGSITAAEGWRQQVEAELHRRFPTTEFDFVNAGIPSLGSTPGAFRLHRDVLASGAVDLLFVEAAVNDDTNGFSDLEQVRGMEGIVRQALLDNPALDIVLLHFVDPGKMDAIRAGKTPAVITNHDRVAEHYHLPSINLAREVTERIDAGEFTWEKDFKGLHPTPFGHALYADAIARLLTAAWNLPVDAVDREQRPLPEPLDPASYYRGQLLNPADAVDSQQVTLIDGWRLDRHWKPEGKASTRPGFVDVPALIAETPGATLSLEFDGRGLGLFVVSGPDTGNLEFRVDHGPWKQQELYTQWSSNLHLPWAKMLVSELAAGRHHLELRVGADSDARSQGTAIRIIHFLINESGSHSDQP